MKKTRQILLFLSVLLLLVTALPMAVMADETDENENLPSQASVRAHQAKANRVKIKTPDSEDLEEPESEDPEEMSERALFVAVRNEQARAWGIPPGHVNLFDKLSALTEQTRADIHTWFTNPEAPMRIRDLAKAIKEARKAAMGDEAIVGEQET